MRKRDLWGGQTHGYLSPLPTFPVRMRLRRAGRMRAEPLSMKLFPCRAPNLAHVAGRARIPGETTRPMHRARERQKDEAQACRGSSTLQNHPIWRGN